MILRFILNQLLTSIVGRVFRYFIDGITGKYDYGNKNMKDELDEIFSELRTPKHLERYVAIDVTAITKIIFDDRSAIKFSNYKSC